MNDSPTRWRAIATFTILASALSFALAGCTNKTSPVPAAQTPPAAPGGNPATAANSVPGNPAPAPNPAPAKPAPQPALVLPCRHSFASASQPDHRRQTCRVRRPLYRRPGRARGGRQHRCRALRFCSQRRSPGSPQAWTLQRKICTGVDPDPAGSQRRHLPHRYQQPGANQKRKRQAQRSLYRRRRGHGYADWRTRHRRRGPACRRPGWRRGRSSRCSLYRQPRSIHSRRSPSSPSACRTHSPWLRRPR